MVSFQKHLASASDERIFACSLGVVQKNDIRKTMVETMRKEFADLDLTYSIGGQISFDVFPKVADTEACMLKGRNPCVTLCL